MVDEETFRRIKNRRDSFGRFLRRGIRCRDGVPLLRRKHGMCPFFTEEKICGIQAFAGEEYMPDACIVFPRLRTNYGLFAEEGLSLACPQVVRLFLRHLKDLAFSVVEKEITYSDTGSNRDYPFLTELTKIRAGICKEIAREDCPRPQLYAALLSYAEELQQHYISSGMPEPYAVGEACVPFDFSLPTLPASKSFSFSVTDTDHMITGGFFHAALKKSSPHLYRLCRAYFKEFDNLTLAEANLHAQRINHALLTAHPRLEEVFRGFFIYYIQTRFLETYENYSFLRAVRLGILHTHLLETFCGLYYNRHHSLTEEELVLIITVYSRRGCHNPMVEQEMYNSVFP